MSPVTEHASFVTMLRKVPAGARGIRGLFTAVAALALMTLAAGAQAESAPAAAIAGVWRTDSGREVVIGPCDSDMRGAYCGVVAKGDLSNVAALETSSTAAQNPADVHFRDQPLRFLRVKAPAFLGKVILEGFHTLDGRLFKDGVIFNPHSGQKYRATLALNGENSLLVTGCLGPICKGQVWTRKL